jgi:hypothetical protein
MSVYIGIDNGVKSGALVALGQCGRFIEAITMPQNKHRSRNEVNIRAVHKWISDITNGNLSNAEYVIEEPNNSRTPSTAYSVASSFHSLRGFFDTKFLPFERITPQSWQKAMLGKVPAGKTKEYALNKARELWPDETFYATPRCKTPHQGIVDAALIAEYGRIQRL